MYLIKYNNNDFFLKENINNCLEGYGTANIGRMKVKEKKEEKKEYF